MACLISDLQWTSLPSTFPASLHNLYHIQLPLQKVPQVKCLLCETPPHFNYFRLALTSFCRWPQVLLLEETAVKKGFLSTLPKPFIL